MKKALILVVLFLGASVFTGCSQKMPELNGTGGSSNGVIDSGYSSSQVPTIQNDDQINQMSDSNMDSGSNGMYDGNINSIENNIQTIYFATDSYRISDSEMTKIAHNSEIFNSDVARAMAIKIEGNCDEWGTDEYNYALGLKRAKSAKDSLVRAGVDEGRMSLTSYGESKPICSEHNAACWQQNRRVDFKLLPQ